MRPGKLPEPPLKRAVLGPLKEGTDNKKKNIGVGCDAGFGIYREEAGNFEEKEVRIYASDAVCQGTVPADLYFGFHRGANSMFASGGVPRWVTITLLLPEDWQEPDIRGLMSKIKTLCADRKIEILGGQTETLPGLTDLVINFHFMGTKYRGDFPLQTKPEKVKPGDAIVMSGFPAADLAGKWLVEEREILEKRFCPAFLAQAEEKVFGGADFPSIERTACPAMDFGVKSMHDIGEGGIFGALRELGEREGCGLQVDLQKIPIQQEVIELCEVFDRNPYQTKSCGALLMVTPDPEGLMRKLADVGISAAEIGRITGDRKMTICHREEIRYLDHPQMDECFKMMRKDTETGKRQ
ncbi:MAG: AIR synthase related protein [Lachnospiraceae bacterium]|nr:AIR synthase related protein [Lachnospiraceae bacterium]